jgi:hypothetical protein
MFVSSSHEVVRHAKIEGAVLFARKEINVVGNPKRLWLWIPGSALRAAPE